MPDNTTAVVAFQGEVGAYSEQAAYEYFGPEAATLPCLNFEDVFQAVQQGKCSHGILPIENSLAGSIHHNYDLLLQSGLQIVGEYYLRISHCLMVLPGASLEDLRRVYSHPQALAQCQNHLRQMNLEAMPAADTAGSASMVSRENDLSQAALASRRAAQVYHLNILREQMEDDPANYTRFLIVCLPDKRPDFPAQLNDFKTSVVISLNNQPGALFKALSVFALRDIDLTKIESRPIPGKPWEYMFYIDFAGSVQEETCQRALTHLDELSATFRLLGWYPRQPPSIVQHSG